MSLMIQVILAVLYSVYGLSHGIRPAALFAHACAAILIHRFPLSLLLGIDTLICECTRPVSGSRELAVVALLFSVVTFITLWGLSDPKASALSGLISSLLVILVSHQELREIWGSNIRASHHNVAINTELQEKQRYLQIVKHPHCAIEGEIELLSPIVKGMVDQSPFAETTPSLFARSPLITDSTSSDVDVDRENDWYYVDLAGSVQGPFPGHLMRHWYESGFLLDELQVSTQKEDRRGFAAISHLKKAYGGSIPFF